MLGDDGFDIAHAFDARVIAELVPLDPARPTAVLVGNTRALWPKFLASIPDDPNPIERYTEDSLARAHPNAPTWFSHRRYGTAFFPFQRIAVLAGLGTLAPTGLVIHPTYGPWFALRALVLVPGTPPPLVAAPTYRCTGTCEAALATALASNDWRAWLAVRDACTTGRAYRYSDDQIAYHYTKARALLR